MIEILEKCKKKRWPINKLFKTLIQDNCFPGFERHGDKCCFSLGCHINEIDHDNCAFLGCDSAAGGCTNTWMGEDHCHCNSGYQLNEDGITCEDIDECTENTDNCIGKDAFTACDNQSGTFKLGCPDKHLVMLHRPMLT